MGPQASQSISQQTTLRQLNTLLFDVWATQVSGPQFCQTEVILMNLVLQPLQCCWMLAQAHTIITHGGNLPTSIVVVDILRPGGVVVILSPRAGNGVGETRTRIVERPEPFHVAGIELRDVAYLQDQTCGIKGVDRLAMFREKARG